MVYSMSIVYVQIRSGFSVYERRKCIIFSQTMVAATAIESPNGVFQTSSILQKKINKALPNLSVHFSKVYNLP